ncbi:hypothetical protein THAOC_14931, partial [Thalassiosira oceanica]
MDEGNIDSMTVAGIDYRLYLTPSMPPQPSTRPLGAPVDQSMDMAVDMAEDGDLLA